MDESHTVETWTGNRFLMIFDVWTKLQNTRPLIYIPLNNTSIHCYILPSTKDSDTCK